MSEARSWNRGQAGFTLVEVLVALGLVGAIGVLASGAAQALAKLAGAAHAEAVGLAAASGKLEELIASEPDARSSGNDAISMDGIDVARVWRVMADVPAPRLYRLEVTARWSQPSLTMLTLVAVSP